MKNYRIYIYATLIFVLSYALLIAFVVVPSFVKFQMSSLLQNNIDLSRQEIEQFSLLSNEYIVNGFEKDRLFNTIQKAISGSENEIIFLSVFDWSGKIRCYPDITKVGEINIKKSNAISNMGSVIAGEELYDYIINIKDIDNVINESEIIGLKPISSSDLIVAAHLNLKSFNFQIKMFKDYVYNVFLVSGLVLLLLGLVIIRMLSMYYEKIIDKIKVKFEDGVLNLSKLNESLEVYQKNILEAKEAIAVKTTQKQESNEITKKRLLTYVRNELMPIAIEDISYVYVENTITYVVRNDGKKFTAGNSLDQIYTSLDQKIFFRANRQIIVAIYAIDKIIKYGNSALKIEMKPISEIDIIIGKNKTSIFKQWLNM